MPELLLELLSEEIPARMQADAADRLLESFIELLDKEKLGNLENYLVSDDDVDTFVTPRRLVAVARNIPTSQPDIESERKGPRVGAPEEAIQGFLKGVGFQSIEQCEQRETPKGPAWFAVIQRKGRPTVEVLKDKLPDLVYAFSWPKSMRWRNTAVRWVRPLHGFLCVFDGKAVPGEIGFASTIPEETQIVIPFTNTTLGHRFHAPRPFKVKDFADYKAKLLGAKVMLDAAERRAKILADAKKLAKKAKLALKPDDELLKEVTGLAEWPVVLMGDIDAAFMDLPPEVLSTAMRHHQKYFSLVDKSGGLAPRFIVVANTEADDGGKRIVAGNERVLRARLSDAKFFWDQDRKRTLEDRVEALKGRVFHTKLGSVEEKVARVVKLAGTLAESTGADPGMAERAALLCKADLSTEMVGEFPELQGVMGRYYALHDGEAEVVGEAIAEHYSPQGPNDTCPSAPVSVAVALADKIDSLAAFFEIDEKPTGSKDPFALRRAALGVIRLIVENGLRVPLATTFPSAVGTDLLSFFADRLKVHLKGQGVRHDHIDAVFALGGEDDLVRLLARVAALEAFLDTDDGANLLIAYRRAANIVRIEGKKDDTTFQPAAYEPEMAKNIEVALWNALQDVRGGCEPLLEKENFTDAMAVLARLRSPVDTFFDEVTVNVEDNKLRRNRLCLLACVVETMNQVADFSRIEGGER